MTDAPIRPLPFMEQEQLVGVISIVNGVKAQHEQLTMENHFLKNYIQH